MFTRIKNVIFNPPCIVIDFSERVHSFLYKTMIIMIMSSVVMGGMFLYRQLHLQDYMSGLTVQTTKGILFKDHVGTIFVESEIAVNSTGSLEFYNDSGKLMKTMKFNSGGEKSNAIFIDYKFSTIWDVPTKVVVRSSDGLYELAFMLIDSE